MYSEDLQVRAKKLGINYDIFKIHSVPPPKKEEEELEVSSCPKQEEPPVFEPETEPINDIQPSLSIIEPTRNPKSYNLRSSFPVKKAKRIKRSKCEIKFSDIDIDNYHHNKDEASKKLLNSTKLNLRAQVDKFENNSRSYIVMSWLNTARIFEYKPNQKKYSEIRRIPDRYIPLSSQIITCLHYDDSKFYMGYLWGHRDASEEERFKPYMERRDIYGRLLDRPYFYDHPLQSIHSDKEFVYVRTIANTMHIYRKALYNFVHYRIDFTSILTNPLISTWIEMPHFKSYTRLPLITATTKEILVTQYDALSHLVVQCYKFDNQSDDNYDIVSIEKLDHLIIIHRNSLSMSRLEFGFMAKVDGSENYLFVHEASIAFKSHRIFQVKQHGTNLYIFGICKSKYELACLFLPSLRPLWTTRVKDVDNNCLIMPHDDHVAIIKENQELLLVKKKLDIGPNSMFTKMVIETNKHLQTLGASVFQKLQ